MQRAQPGQRPRGRKAGGEGLRPADVERSAGTGLHAGEGPFWFSSPRFLFPWSLQPGGGGARQARRRGRAGKGRGEPRRRRAGRGRGPSGPAQRGCPGRSAGARGAAGAGGDGRAGAAEGEWLRERFLLLLGIVMVLDYFTGGVNIACYPVYLLKISV